MNEQVQITTSIDGLRQFARDADRFGLDRALILAYARERARGLRPDPTVEDIATAVGLMVNDAHDMVQELVSSRRLDWTVVSGSHFVESRVRAA